MHIERVQAKYMIEKRGLLSIFGDRKKTVASEHGEAQTGFRLWTQDSKEEWMIDHKGNRWGWGLSTASSALKPLTEGHCGSFSALLVNL